LTRTCKVCAVVQTPERDPEDRPSAGSPRFEAHHTSRVPETLVWVCQNCHHALHDGLLPELEVELLPLKDRERPRASRSRRDHGQQEALLAAYYLRRAADMVRLEGEARCE
jgi:hypothetical protein